MNRAKQYTTQELRECTAELSEWDIKIIEQYSEHLDISFSECVGYLVHLAILDTPEPDILK